MDTGYRLDLYWPTGDRSAVKNGIKFNMIYYENPLQTLLALCEKRPLWSVAFAAQNSIYAALWGQAITVGFAAQNPIDATFCEDWPLRFVGFAAQNSIDATPDNNVRGANMGPTWLLSAPDGSHIGPMNLAIRDTLWGQAITVCWICCTEFN